MASMSASPSECSDAPIFSAEIWPHRSLSMRGFRLVMLGAALGLSAPLFALMGGAGFWVVGAFCLIDLLLLYVMMRLTYRSGRVRETVRIWPDRLEVERIEANGRRKGWSANPHWVQLRLHPTPEIEDYLVLSSSGREIELGAFLTPEERRSLAAALRRALVDARRHASPKT